MYIPTPQPQLWLRTITTDSQNELSRKVGIPERTLYNQIRKGRLSAENVLKIAEVYNIHPLRALIDNGYVDEKIGIKTSKPTSLPPLRGNSLTL